MKFVLLAPGPSMSAEVAARVRGEHVGVVGNCFELAPWAAFLAANDVAWWRAYPQAKQFAGRKFSCSAIPGLEQHIGSTNWNSGVLALDVAVALGATEIDLYGFDMHGTHYFGPYENGLSNTKPERRQVHMGQYERWARANPGVGVTNCTPGSALKCFPFE
jgi:hypothetical protein